MTWQNYFVSSVHAKTTEGHIAAETLREVILHHDGSEAYHCAFDLEAREDFKDYRGSAKPALDLAWFDFDAERLENSKRDAASFVQFIGTDCAISFSGNKGFHVGVPYGAFGLVPSETLPKQLHGIAHALKAQFKTLDTSIYNANRKFRALGSINQKSGLYKVALSLTQLSSLSVEQIKEIASKRGDLTIPILQSGPLEHLKNLSKPVVVAGSGEDEYFTQFESFDGKVCIQKLLKKKCDVGGRHRTLLVLASDFYHTKVHRPEAAEKLLEWGKKNGLYPDRVEEIYKILNDTYDGRSSYSFGCQTPEKKEHCSAKCALWKKLSREKRPQPMDAPASTLSDKPKENEIVKALINTFGDALIKQEHSVFKYDGLCWKELSVGERDKILAGIRTTSGGLATSRTVDSVYKSFVRELPHVPEGINLFNPNPRCVNFKNGTLHLRSDLAGNYKLDFLTHNKEDYATNVLPFNYDPNDKSVNVAFLETLDRVFEGDQDKDEKILALKQMYGACLIPAFPHLFMFWGMAGTGKSTLILLAQKLVSEANCSSVDPTEFDGFNMESMVGKLINIETDIETDKPISDSQVKRIVDRRAVRIKRKGIADAYGMLPAIHIFGGNKIPPTRDGESGAHTRRWTFIETKNFQAKGEYNKEFHEWVFDQNPIGILNFALEGLRDLLTHKGHYLNPQSGKNKMVAWQLASDPVGLFLKTIQEKETQGLYWNPQEKIARTELFAAFMGWAEESGYKFSPLTRNKFYDSLRERKFMEHRTESGRYWLGIGKRGSASTCEGVNVGEIRSF